MNYQFSFKFKLIRFGLNIHIILLNILNMKLGKYIYIFFYDCILILYSVMLILLQALLILGLKRKIVKTNNIYYVCINCWSKAESHQLWIYNTLMKTRLSTMGRKKKWLLENHLVHEIEIASISMLMLPWSTKFFRRKV